MTGKLVFGEYPNGRTAIALKDAKTGEPFGKFTVNVPEVYLEDDEILVKTWSENEEWYEQVLEKNSDIFEDAGRTVPAGYAEASVWRIKNGS